jgi:hypothetical protein
LVETDNGHLELMGEGQTAHSALMKRVSETRELLRRGITDEESVSLVVMTDILSLLSFARSLRRACTSSRSLALS